ncbi:MAG: hypothetical protein ACRDRK_20545 [Pseudonocardia sp.]
MAWAPVLWTLSPRVPNCSASWQPDLLRWVVADLPSMLDRRERLFRDARIVSVEQRGSRRAAGLRFCWAPVTDAGVSERIRRHG